MQKQHNFIESLRSVVSVGFDFALAGGCCRNTVFGLTPKDYDVVIILNDPECRTYKGAFALIKELSAAISIMGGSSRSICAYGAGEFGERHLALLKVSYGGDEYDLLIEPVANVKEAVDAFDCNINQLIFVNGLGIIPLCPNLDIHNAPLVWLKEVSEKRRLRMEAWHSMYVQGNAL
ncbi:nucleotidyltransferase [Pectobacterium phage PP81]|uniref:Putative nucleotidyl transferase n=1 Tax=Pectobacterium phage PP81 TaxID=1927014 RepID=A0A1L7DRZ5_9CAUD|nr:nucleotidyltransferase [Pectobacterium phage PP81]APU03047.1 putative nucleotidyl transferase [Pectobacterium phage PP81]